VDAAFAEISRADDPDDGDQDFWSLTLEDGTFAPALPN
jgi:hypothetical protein